MDLVVHLGPGEQAGQSPRRRHGVEEETGLGPLVELERLDHMLRRQHARVAREHPFAPRRDPAELGRGQLPFRVWLLSAHGTTLGCAEPFPGRRVLGPQSPALVGLNRDLSHRAASFASSHQVWTVRRHPGLDPRRSPFVGDPLDWVQSGGTTVRSPMCSPRASTRPDFARCSAISRAGSPW